ncbi:hypothetical protein [Gordonia humi]|uniref:Trypsin n=1 Tax=Gordonia humi TaxID=686429 RepID=A0A840F3D8_9ACTN|nr:hypothetical protein [Gordonia humi]MBB4134800.1 hypothetical protein [Gordonia humi]
MTNYPQFPPPDQQPPRPQQHYPAPHQPQNPYGGQPQNSYMQPPTPKKKYLWLKIALAIVGVLLLVLVIAAFILGADSDETEDTGTGATPSLGAEPSQVEIDTDKVGSGEVMRDSTNFKHLSTPQRIMPGAKYVVSSGDSLSFCSFGWMVREPTEPNQIYNLTAGHCGKPGDVVYLDPSGKEDPSGFVQIGTFIAQDYAGEETIKTGNDYALIAFDPAVNEYISATPDISTLSGQKLQVVGVATGADLAKWKPYTCHLGFRSGLSCGPFQKMTTETNLVFNGITDHGDSGGVIWSFEADDPTQIAASGIVSWVEFSEDAASTNGKTIDTVIEALGLQLLRD